MTDMTIAQAASLTDKVERKGLDIAFDAEGIAISHKGKEVARLRYAGGAYLVQLAGATSCVVRRGEDAALSLISADLDLQACAA
jgi:hypothetical protein